MASVQVIESKIDKSINFVESDDLQEGFLEARFVQRTEDTMIVYLSSQRGCQFSCRFCHLTQTGQTSETEASFKDYLSQTRSVMDYSSKKYDLTSVRTVHVNFMARGDVFNNQGFLSNPWRVIVGLEQLIQKYLSTKVEVKFKLSTIFPWSVSESLFRNTVLKEFLFLRGQGVDVEIYYSLYSLQEKFRKKWIPKTLLPRVVGDIFKGTKEGLRLHHALIAGQNDSKQDVRLIHDWLEEYDLEVMFNLVRYNPFDDGSGTESSDFVRSQYMDWMRESPRVKLVQEIPKVGFDAKASCGMFVS